jgi:hypothetical protein
VDSYELVTIAEATVASDANEAMKQLFGKTPRPTDPLEKILRPWRSTVSSSGLKVCKLGSSML